MMLAGWGRFPRLDCRLLEPHGEGELPAAIEANTSLIARGNGRAYGDAALNPRGTLLTRRLARLIAFEPETGLLVCEAGTLLADIVATFVPRGWFVPVTPGTKYVTVGGMVAADVHGKNHHVAGSFGRHIAWFDLALADGSTVRCGPDQNSGLFAATLGGMGLTGVILRVAFRLVPVETAYIRQRTLRAANLDEAMALFEANGGATYSVGWIDCLARGDRLGRSLIYLGEHAAGEELPAELRIDPLRPRPGRPLRVPVDLPGAALNRFSLSAFNEVYFRRGKPGTQFVRLDPYFYPLDSIAEWNRIYGRRGFLQYQFVLPKAASRDGMTAILARIAAHGSGSFLAVLKLFGPQEGLLSFPMEGYTLALDFAATIANLNLLTTLDAIVADHGGRLYLAKDARAGAAMMVRGYPGLSTFAEARDRADPAHRFSSLQSQRLGL